LAVSFTFRCPHCGAEIFDPPWKIVWAKVTPCHSCHQSFHRSRDQFGYACMICASFYGLVIAFPLLIFFICMKDVIALGPRSGWLFVALPLSAWIGGSLLSLVFGYLFADLRPERPRTSASKGRKTGLAALFKLLGRRKPRQEKVPSTATQCPHCGRMDPELGRRGYCLHCKEDV